MSDRQFGSAHGLGGDRIARIVGAIVSTA